MLGGRRRGEGGLERWSTRVGGEAGDSLDSGHCRVAMLFSQRVVGVESRESKTVAWYCTWKPNGVLVAPDVVLMLSIRVPGLRVVQKSEETVICP